jgi:hypothetical protein
LQLLADDNASNDAGTAVNAAFEAIGGPQPIVLAEQVASVPLVGLIEGGDGDGDPGDGDGDGDSESEESGDTTGDTGTGNPADDTGDGGCNCRTAERTGGSFGWLILIPLFVLRRK